MTKKSSIPAQLLERVTNVQYRHYRLTLLLSLLMVVPLGYWVRFSQGPLPEWLNDALGSIAYEIFWIFLLLLLFPAIPAGRAAIAIGLITSGLECLQLWQPPFLQALRATTVGRLVLGNTFTWTDFVSYFIGGVVAWRWARSLQQK